jgi:hypothetical protein
MVEQFLDELSTTTGLHCIKLRYFNAAGADSGGQIGEWHTPETHVILLALEAAPQSAGSRYLEQITRLAMAPPSTTWITRTRKSFEYPIASLLSPRRPQNLIRGPMGIPSIHSKWKML